MTQQLPDDIQREVETTIRAKASESRVLDVYATAQEIRSRHAVPEIRIEDIATTVARLASQYGCAVELGGQRAEPLTRQSA
ncbi:hypothetical protein [Bosea sp. 124]|uniref:hypothetical protein n=1 Tax=Bosea sp. 124 TaxID=2135642 RepID=UPI000D397487|nr:hypothetical protein [Bosea sp. 124]PTM40493.1 hypothetical protein C8D03_2010 [Bosea sp. 124]